MYAIEPSCAWTGDAPDTSPTAVAKIDQDNGLLIVILLSRASKRHFLCDRLLLAEPGSTILSILSELSWTLGQVYLSMSNKGREVSNKGPITISIGATPAAVVSAGMFFQRSSI